MSESNGTPIPVSGFHDAVIDALVEYTGSHEEALRIRNKYMDLIDSAWFNGRPVDETARRIAEVLTDPVASMEGE